MRFAGLFRGRRSAKSHLRDARLVRGPACRGDAMILAESAKKNLPRGRFFL